MQIEHKTEKGTILFVKVPDDTESFDITGKKLWFDYKEQNYPLLKDTDFILLPYESFKLIGLTREVTEEQAKIMVDKVTYKLFFDYKHMLNRINHRKNKALESFKNLMDVKEVFETNPYHELMRYLDQQSDSGLYDLNKIKYDKAQSRTGKWVVLFKQD